jgi:hypothetical protein
MRSAPWPVPLSAAALVSFSPAVEHFEIVERVAKFQGAVPCARTIKGIGE